MLNAPKPLLFGGGNDGTVARQTRGAIAVVVIETEDEHRAALDQPD